VNACARGTRDVGPTDVEVARPDGATVAFINTPCKRRLETLDHHTEIADICICKNRVPASAVSRRSFVFRTCVWDSEGHARIAFSARRTRIRTSRATFGARTKRVTRRTASARRRSIHSCRTSPEQTRENLRAVTYSGSPRFVKNFISAHDTGLAKLSLVHDIKRTHQIKNGK